MEMTSPIAIILLNESGRETAEKLQRAYPEALLHGLAGRTEETDLTFTQTATHLQELFRAGTPIIGICAAAILIRCLAPVLRNKLTEPPVIAVADDGSNIVPLLGGHHGANNLAREIAVKLSAHAAITTASDIHFNIALDAPPRDLALANPQHIKGFIARLLGGEKIRLEGTHEWLSSSDLPFATDGTLTIEVTPKAGEGGEDRLLYHPKTLSLGVGCERNTPPGDLVRLAKSTLTAVGLSPLAVGAVCSIDLKSDEAAVHAVAAHFGLHPRFFSAAELAAETPRLATPSDIVLKEVGCYGVSEGAALAAAGPEGKLIIPKEKSQRATCAVAESPTPIDSDSIGRRQGKLSVIGIGPGQEPWRTPEASRLIEDATDLVAYGLYLDLLGNSVEGKTRHDFGLGEEEKRVRAALNLAAEGKNVALISSGDIGIYAMATLVFELIDREENPDWGRLDIQVTPGISALQAAAARAGAPLGHDFCTISLSDLLTPWEVIEKRIKAAAEGDFVISFYNPVSLKRRTQLHAAKRILLEHRPTDTPVIIARNLGRETESVSFVTLSDLDPEAIDMLTLVMVGSSESRLTTTNSGAKSWAYTPRGYSGKNADSKIEAGTEK
ncbi:precorrin-3B C(17)-methyltransferase [Sneathiella sp. CAU 1612]|uniref:Precorrin-3B C(17)-methyltransferase n=1 Tax=Sneathiella sedimenti TaxID=2816034 RepID=A0ABS3F6R0_9PROT|nr:precorrin-3B C(17)-methyltransferase [Sneathiella sedimenti]MBO0334171.1 precorrin-3B C(17)-methyltransferase [Sneathiella sedimenti]